MGLKPARKSRTKTRKPKFLSLRLEITPVNTQLSGEMSAPIRHQQQLNLFPLHPQNPAEDENVADFFAAADGGGDNLTTLLGGSSSEEHNALSPSLTYACCGAQDSEDGALVRTAMRSKERDASEEKWVCYEEVTSCAADHRYKVEAHGLSLKLDYQEILNAWSDKGPLYIHLEAPQRVPEVYDDFLARDPSNGPNGGLWTVPENMSGNMKVKREQEEEEEFKIGQREASVLRYKEKRHNRLFSKRIRYEVRKINAEKRPRMKGRFVKRS